MMETIRVNMTPCEDIKTIHASQNDNEGREWGFELHNNGEKIDSSSISDQLVFKAYEGGTEEILPTNGSTPTTSPFKGDIKYPQGLLSDQEFLYRESPTEEDGLANVVGIKGQTLKWNQLIQNGNFESTDSWALRGTNTSFTVSNNVASITAGSQWGGINHNLPFTVNQSHKFLVIADIKGTTDNYISIGSGANAYVTQNNVWQRLYIELPSASSQWLALTIGDRRSSDWTEFNVRNAMLIDLTLVFGSGNEPTFEEFASLFPLDYYPFSQGSLIPFNGNGIKTTPNIANVEYEQGAINSSVAGNPYESNKASNTTRIRVKNLIYNEDGKTYSLYFNSSLFDAVIQPYDSNGLSAPMVAPYDSWKTTSPIVFTATGSVAVAFRYKTSATITADAISQIKPIMYKEGDESVLNLPISTYFPTGMKSVGTVYDELTETKAITRIGSRAYQSGDESDTSVITDGTTTYYVLATPTETSFTTASLVTENAEIPLSNEDGVLIGKCTEQLSSESGFFDAKIKLADEDGECYSNKIQLHIERSPQ